jgi:hypothetical protein
MHKRSLAIARRCFLGDAATAGTAILARAVGTGRAQNDTSAYLAVTYEAPGRGIASDFVGLSYESAIHHAACRAGHRCHCRHHARRIGCR